ncbi:N-acetylneuraminate synthase [Teredinibacter turnerae]|uniref:N-acetylneuraminate synthase n=1 Tax=Teredinibacter turnerae TaxID=2426 RepID=UPI000380C1DC|nr:N-acetylneuraminate synthase [Teredinibacter turnerae]
MSTLIIAEAGVNHNGDLEKALDLVHCAAEAGADYVKFQTFVTGENITRDAPKARYQQETTGSTENQYDMVAALELTATDFYEIKAACDKYNIGFLSTAFDFPSADLLQKIGVDYIKIPSGDLTNLPLLRYQAQFARPFLISTGMATCDDIQGAIVALENCYIQRSNITLLHCTTEYPAPYSELNLRALHTLAETFGTRVGYSDHSLGIEVPIAAVAMGASVIEKHFTLDCNLPGPDHRASLPPDQLAAMVSAIRHIDTAMGDGKKQPTRSEQANRLIARKSIVARTAINAGDIFSIDNLAVKRPGTGISPMNWDEVIGRQAKRDYLPDELIEL